MEELDPVLFGILAALFIFCIGSLFWMLFDLVKTAKEFHARNENPWKN
jgi:hypothetical protein